MTGDEIKTFDVVTMEFPTSYENAFLYIANPKNIPEWTVYLVEADDTSTTIQTPEGKIKCGFITEASFESGVIDWCVISNNGKKVDRSHSRLNRLPNGNCVYSFMFFINPGSDEDPTKVLENKREQMVIELEKLKEIFTTENES